MKDFHIVLPYQSEHNHYKAYNVIHGTEEIVAIYSDEAHMTISLVREFDSAKYFWTSKELDSDIPLIMILSAYYFHLIIALLAYRYRKVLQGLQCLILVRKE